VLADAVVPYDGIVTVHDLTLLGANFGLDDTNPGFNAEVDYGPTDDATGTGIPLPDGTIDFDDEMIAALNYGAGAKAAAAAPVAAGRVDLAWRPSGPATWTLELVAPRADLKGVRLSASLPLGLVPVVRAGAAVAAGDAQHLLLNDPRSGLDAGLVVLGAGMGVAAAGALLTVELPAGADLDLLGADKVDIELRGLDNQVLEFSLQGKSAGQLPVLEAYTTANGRPHQTGYYG